MSKDFLNKFLRKIKFTENIKALFVHFRHESWSSGKASVHG